jgi:GTP cyclohydrolase II
MLHALGLPRVALLTNNSDKVAQLSRLGVTVTEQVPTGVHLSTANARYLAAKARHGKHTLDLPGGPPTEWLADDSGAHQA